jgi:hypothetical protein
VTSLVQCQFKQQGDSKNIDEAIKLNRETLHLCPAPHPDRGSSLYNLAAAVHTRFEQQRDPKDIDEAIELLEASTYSSSSPFSQFTASDTWARLLITKDTALLSLLFTLVLTSFHSWHHCIWISILTSKW